MSVLDLVDKFFIDDLNFFIVYVYCCIDQLNRELVEQKVIEKQYIMLVLEK